MLTKDQISDLRSFIAQVVQCQLNAHMAKSALTDATNKLEQFLFNLTEKPL